MGLLAGAAGILYASRIATATSTVGAGAELQAITAVILGGASLSGGRGTIWGALIGVFFMGLMKNVLDHFPLFVRVARDCLGRGAGSRRGRRFPNEPAPRELAHGKHRLGHGCGRKGLAGGRATLAPGFCCPFSTSNPADRVFSQQGATR